MKQQININKIKPNPKNPRQIKDDKFKKLVKSIQEFPEMLEKRPIVVDEDMVILGGNMRLKASKEAGLKEVYIDIAKDWTEEQKKEFIVKDNVGYGEWDFDLLSVDYDMEELDEWGMDVGFSVDDVDFDNIKSNEDRETKNKEQKVKCPKCDFDFIV